MTIEELFDRFLLSRRAQGVSAATIAGYRTQVLAFAAWHAEQGRPELTPDLMEAYVVYLRTRPRQSPRRGRQTLAPSSIVTAYRALKAFFAWCVKRRLLDHSPMVGVTVAKPPAVEPRVALNAEVAALIRSIPVDDWIGLRDYLIIHVIYYCGLRVGELVQLTERSFDLSDPTDPTLRIPGGKTGAGKVPLLRDVVEAFLAYQIHRPRVDCDRLFVAAWGDFSPRTAGLTEKGVRYMLRQRCEAAGIRYLNPHSFRHGVAMHLLNDRRADASLVQRILRHSSIRTTTGFYARWSDGALGDQFRSILQEGSQ
jgi:integrase